MYDILTSNAQSVLADSGVQTTSAGIIKFTSDNEGCVEFIDNSKTYRLNFVKKDNEFDLSSEVETIENVKSMTDAVENVDATTSNTEEGTTDTVENEKTTGIEEMKAMYESKMADMETKMGTMMTDIEELKACMPKNVKSDVEIEISKDGKEAEDITDATDKTIEDSQEIIDKPEVIENQKTAKPYYGDYAEHIIQNNKTFI
jgi:hypothetical protein